MTISILITNTGSTEPLLVSVVSQDERYNGELCIYSGEHYHIEPNNSKEITIWKGKQLILSEEVPTHVVNRASNGG